MADSSDTDLSAMIQAMIHAGAGTAAQAQLMAAIQQVMANEQKNLDSANGLKTPDYQQLSPQEQAASGLGGIQDDAVAKGQQQGAINQLGQIAQSGGLNLADRAAQNQLEQTLSRNNSARQSQLAQQYAARGQLGSGAQLAMDLTNNQNAAMNANNQAQSLAGQAQQRAMQAIIQQGGLAKGMSDDEYARQAAAAQANDSINRFNAGQRTNTGEYNNKLQGQSYEDQLKKLGLVNQETNTINNTITAQGKQAANGTVSNGQYGSDFVKSIFGSGSKAKTNPDGTTSTDTPDAPGTQGTSDYNANLQIDDTDPGFGDY